MDLRAGCLAAKGQDNFRKFERPGDAAIDGVALLKVDVLEEVAANRARRNGVAYISMPDHCRVAPSTGIRGLRRYSSIAGLVDCGTE